jgi:hypothetical protein
MVGNTALNKFVSKIFLSSPLLAHGEKKGCDLVNDYFEIFVK